MGFREKIQRVWQESLEALGREDLNATEMRKGNLKNINEFVNKIPFDTGLKKQVRIRITLVSVVGIRKVNYFI